MPAAPEEAVPMGAISLTRAAGADVCRAQGVPV